MYSMGVDILYTYMVMVQAPVPVPCKTTKNKNRTALTSMQKTSGKKEKSIKNEKDKAIQKLYCLHDNLHRR